MSGSAEPLTIAMAATTANVVARNDDPLTVALRSETGSELSLEELVNLTRTDQDHRQYPSTVGSLTTTVFSSQEKSSATRLTSAGTSYVIQGYNGKGEGNTMTYASSLSATHGSASEVEAEQDNFLVGVGDQFESNPLKGAARARRRTQPGHSSKSKKVPLVIHQNLPRRVSSNEDLIPEIWHDTRRNGQGKSYPRLRRSKNQSNRLTAANEECVSSTDESNPTTHLSRVRINVVVALCILMILTFALSAFAAHYTGKDRLACTKGIIFCATVLISSFTVLIMNLTGRTLQEALLAGLLQLVIGFALVIEIRDFMGHVP